jgi:S-adenosylmethionine-diacylglycerol 3-amino-3-carboxypropyl transferase
MSQVQFAVVREDPIVEQRIIHIKQPQNVLMIASGGCTALSLKATFPSVSFSLFDFNTQQIQLVQRKISALSITDNAQFKRVFNIGQDSRQSLNGCGQFESLFRSFRQFIHEFVAPENKLKEMFMGLNQTETEVIRSSIFENKYWPVSFDMFFSDSLLVSLFAEAAIQHAKPGSYPRYFQERLEQGLRAKDYQMNYFLHHIFLGYYLDDQERWPTYLQLRKSPLEFDFFNMSLMTIPNVSGFQLISLSNIFDWMDEKDVHRHLSYLRDHLQTGSIIIFRQLNNDKKYIQSIDGLIDHPGWENELKELDQSLFYNKIKIIERV